MKTALELLHERLDRARAKLEEAIKIAKEDRQLALLEILVAARNELR